MSTPGRDATRDQFERRMRARRVATCVRTARQAIADGRTVEAEERLEEACSLDPDEPEARLLLEELQGLQPPEVGAAAAVGRPAGSGWSHWLAAGVAILALAALAFFWPLERAERRETPARTEPSPTVPATELPAAVRLEPSRGGGTPIDIMPPLGEGVATSGRLPTRLPAERDRLPAGPAPSVTATSRPLPAIGRAGAVPTPDAASAAATQLPVTGTSPDDLPAIVRPVEPRIAVAAPRPADSVGGVATSSAPPARPAETRQDTAVRGTNHGEAGAAAPADPALAALRSAPESGPTDDELIRAALGRYADAYNRLDANAAQRVWPSVDAEALRRAFDGLASQGVVFERCDLRVNGTEATAACRGRARYVPKVGDGEPMSLSRLWIFALKKGEAGWTIVTADAR